MDASRDGEFEEVITRMVARGLGFASARDGVAMEGVEHTRAGAREETTWRMVVRQVEVHSSAVRS